MKNIQLNKKTIAVDVDWNALDVDRIKDDLKSQRESGNKNGIIIKCKDSGESTAVVGIVPEKMKTPSGAAWLAASNQKFNKKPSNFNSEKYRFNEDSEGDFKNWFVVFKTEENNDTENLWLCVIENGVPKVTFDKICDINTVFQDLTTFFSNSENEENGYILITDLENSPEITGAIEALDKMEYVFTNFERLVKGVPVKYKPTVLAASIDPRIILGVLLAAAAFGAYYAYQVWDEEREQNAALLASQAQRQQSEQQKLQLQAKYEKDKQKVVEETVKKANDTLNQLISVGTPKLTVDSWLSLVNKIPLTHTGWKMSQVSCGLTDNIPACKIDLERGDIGINRTLLQDFPDVQINGDKASYTLTGDPIDFAKRNYETLPNSKIFTMETLSNLQEVKFSEVKHAVESSNEITQTITLPAPPVGITQEMTIPPIKMGIAAGGVHIEGTGIWQLPGISAVMNDPSLIVSSLTITTGGDDLKNNGWKLEGSYFIKIADKPTIPVIPPSKTVVGN